MSTLTVTEKTKYFDCLQEAIDYICLAVDNNKSEKQMTELIGGLSKSIVSNMKWNQNMIVKVEEILLTIYSGTKI